MFHSLILVNTSEKKIPIGSYIPKSDRRKKNCFFFGKNRSKVQLQFDIVLIFQRYLHETSIQRNQIHT